MSLMHIPVRIIAENPAEAQAFADVLGGQAGALTHAAGNEQPLVMLVCPSGNMNAVGSAPAVVLGDRRDDVPDGVKTINLPAKLSEILEALEEAVSDRAGFTQARHYKGWALDPVRLSLRTPQESTITLTDTEARLLACLLDAAGEDVTRDTLLARVWGYRPGLETHTLETHIYRLRKKIEADPAAPARILTSGDGYCFKA